MFGAFNALFSGLAFAFVIIALLQQQKQFERQAFETGFFELLKLFRQNVEAMQIPSGNPPKTGKLVLLELAKELRHELYTAGPNSKQPLSAARIKTIYDNFYKSHHALLGDYFRLLFHLMQHIKDAKCLDSRGCRRYGNLVRAGLNGNEIFLLFFNGLSEDGKGSRDYIARFHMFKHLSLGSLDGFLPTDLYPASAIGNQNQEPAAQCRNRKELNK
jgi:hypothetical protein